MASELEIKVAELEQQVLSLSRDLSLEKAKNAYISVTGKGVSEIGEDAINEMLFTLVGGNWVNTPDKTLTIKDISDYAERLTLDLNIMLAQSRPFKGESSKR